MSYWYWYMPEDSYRYKHWYQYILPIPKPTPIWHIGIGICISPTLPICYQVYHNCYNSQHNCNNIIIDYSTLSTHNHLGVQQCPVWKERNTGCPKKEVTLFVKAIIFKPRITKGWYYTHFEANYIKIESVRFTQLIRRNLVN